MLYIRTKFVDTGDPDILQTRRGGGSLMIPGLPFLLSGLFVTVNAFWDPSSFQGGDLPWVVAPIVASIFAAVGAALTFGRTGITINRRKRTVVRWSGLLVPMKKTPYLLDYYNRVTIRKKLRRNQGRIICEYPVVLKGSHGGSAGIVFARPLHYRPARSIGLKITAFLKFPLVDTTSGKKVTREPGKFIELVRKREKRTKEWVPALGPPPDLRARIKEKSGTLIIEIPPQRLTVEIYRRTAIIMAIGAIAAIAAYCINNLRHLKSPDLFVYAPVGIFFLLFAISTILLLARRSYRITASRDLLRVQERFSIRRKVTEIPIDELADLVIGDADLPIGVSRTPDGRYQAAAVAVSAGNPGGHYNKQDMISTKLGGKLFLSFNPPGPRITAYGDNATVNFGKGLHEDELRYLYALIKKKITE